MNQESEAMPPLLWKSAETGSRRQRNLEILIMASAVPGIVALCLAANFFMQAGLAWRCPVMTVLHIPCPGCGSTRALAALSELRWLDAWRFNPLVVTAIPAGLVAFLFRRSLARHARWGWLLFGGAVVLNWLYLYLFLPR